MSERNERCETCRFFEPPLPADDEEGFCHRFPQCVDVVPSYWCGEWCSAEPSTPTALPSLWSLELPVMALNAIEQWGITTTAALLKQTAASLMEIRNVGIISVERIRQRLAIHGLALAGERPE